MADDDKMIITADEAVSLFRGGDRIHNYKQVGHLLMGVDFTRESAEKALRAAPLIEIGGPGCKGAKHPIVMHDAAGGHSFFEADMDKVAEFEAARAAEREA